MPVAGTETIERRETTEAASPARHSTSYEWMTSVRSTACPPRWNDAGRLVSLGCNWPDATAYPREYWNCPACGWSWRVNPTVWRWYHQPLQARR